MGNLAELFKEGQRKSANFKQAWAQYCQMYGSNKHDPAKYDTTFLVGFLNYLGQRGSLAFQMSGILGGMPGSRGYDGNIISTGDPTKDSLIQKVKHFQKSSAVVGLLRQHARGCSRSG